MQNLTNQQIQKAFQLCDMLGLEDPTLAASILQSMDWSVEKAIETMMDSSNNAGPPQPNLNLPKPTIDPPQKKQKQQQPEVKIENHYKPGPELYPYPQQYYQNQQEQSEQDSDHHSDQYQYNFDKQENTKNNKRVFDQAYQQLKLDRTSTQPPLNMQRRLSYDRNIIKNFGSRRHQYQAKLLEDSQTFCKKFFKKNNQLQLKKKAGESIIKNHQNRSFISYLTKNYRCFINFTFGTFMLNLARSHLDKKYLLVYIHQVQFEDSRSIQMLLANRQLGKLINKYCVSYGMFDNSDDYEILQKYVELKDLPAFLIFSYDAKNKKEKFIGSYSIFQKQGNNCIEWVAQCVGVEIQKKSQIKQQKKTQHKTQTKKQQTSSTKPPSQTKKSIKKYTHTDIMTQQNLQYQQMQRIYNLRRQESKIKKQHIQATEQAIQKQKQHFLKFQPKATDQNVIEIRFRLPYSGKSLIRNFYTSQKVREMFDYVHCFGREEFENKYGEFDLTQTFPRLSLADQKDKLIKEVFQGSPHQNLIVQEI